MLFNSFIFIFILLPLAMLGYFGLNRFEKYAAAELFLIIISLWFYGYFNVGYLFIIIGSIFINYSLNYFMSKKQKLKKLLLFFGIVVNIGALFYFKYMGFFVENINSLFKVDFNVKEILLPLGISFFTFQQLSYLIDSYKGNIEKYNFREYALFVLFFPQLIAGPIVLHSETIPQFRNLLNKKFNAYNVMQGLRAFSIGMAKKVIIADYLGTVVNIGFKYFDLLNGMDCIILMLTYTLQIYFDFSGYCDMAVGIAKMFNINLPFNFDSPYKSLTISEFWKRWHITLTRFLTEYLYIPLGGSKKGIVRTCINVAIVFLVSGIWHGANYTFIIWGGLHGIYMIITRIFKKKIVQIHPALNWIVTFSFINITWIIFRASTLEQAGTFIYKIIKFVPNEVSNFISATFITENINKFLIRVPVFSEFLNTSFIYLVLGGLLFVVLGTKNTQEQLKKQGTVISAIFHAGLLVYSILSFSGVSIFLYFNF